MTKLPAVFFYSEGGENMKVSDFIEQAGRPIAYYPEFAKALKSVNATIFLCQLLYWKGKEKKNGWIYKSRREMEEETALSRREQDTARRILKTAGILKEKLAGVPATVHYKINTDRLNDIIEDHLEQKELSRLAESAKLDCTKRVNLNGGNEQTIHRLPETTQKSISRPGREDVRPVSLSKEKKEAVEKEISGKEALQCNEEPGVYGQADGFLDTLDIQSRINMIDAQSGSTKTIGEMMDYVIYYENKTGREVRDVPAFIYAGLRGRWESGNYRRWGLDKLNALNSQ